MSTNTYYLGGGQLSVGISQLEIQAIEAELSSIDGGATKVIKSAINDTLKHIRTGLVRKMRDVLKLLAKDVRERIKPKQLATDDNLVGVLSIDYRPVPLMDFKPRFRKSMGVAVTTIKGQGVQTFKHMFRAQMQSGHVGAFERDPTAPFRPMTRGYWAGRRIKRGPRKGKLIVREPIREAYGPSIVAAFEKTPDLADSVLEDADAYFRARLDSKIEFMLAGGKMGAPQLVGAE